MGNLDDLRELIITNAEGLTGELPGELGNLRPLRYLTVSHTKIQGEIPPEILHLGSLQRLDLSNNQLSGEITPEMAEFLSRRKYVDLRFNRLSGRVSRESPLLELKGPNGKVGLSALLGNDLVFSERMVLASVFHHSLSGLGSTPPEGTPLGDWPGVTTDDNGTVTELSLRLHEIPPEITLLTGLRVLNVLGGDLREIPPEIGAATSLEVLDLSQSLIWELPAELGMLTNLKVLKIRGEYMSIPQGCIPDSLQPQLDMIKSDLGSFTFCTEQAAQDQKEAQDLQDRLEGERDVLVALYNATGGSEWWDNTNWLSNNPVGDWFGVTTDQNGFISELSLYENQLAGTVPSQLGNLPDLKKLSLFGNRLTGCIPKGLQSQLTDVNLGNLAFCP